MKSIDRIPTSKIERARDGFVEKYGSQCHKTIYKSSMNRLPYFFLNT